MAQIKGIKVGDTTYDIFAKEAESAQTCNGVIGLGDNGKGNLELSSVAAGLEKLNLVSADAIQIKPGRDGVKTDVQPIQFDCELGTSACTEYGFKICNGILPKASRVVDLNLNTASLTLDRQKSYDQQSKVKDESFDIKVRYDKWNHGIMDESTNSGPIGLQVKARAIDLRCHDHGGIALQIAGQDGSNHENKIKFESDRTTNIGEDATYASVGGKGLEFGTFNNLHTSLYTGDYRFKDDAYVYGVTRGPLETNTLTGKIDYPTQYDDFKDILNETHKATWKEIIDVARAYKDGTLSAGGGSGSGSEGGNVDLSAYATNAALAEVNTLASEAKTTAENAKTAVDGLTGLTTDVDFLKGRVYRKGKNGNVEIDATGLKQYGTENDASTEGQPDASGIINSASLDLVNDGKIAVKASKEFEIGAKGISIPIKISKKNKYSCGNYEVEGITDLASLTSVLPTLTLSVEKNNYTGTTDEVKNFSTVSVPILDLIKVVSRVDELEQTVKGLTDRVAVLEKGNTDTPTDSGATEDNTEETV